MQHNPDGTAIYTLAGVIAAATIAFIGSQRAARTAFDAQMVQIGVSILSADPAKSDVSPAREWAMTLVEQHSGQAFSEKDRENLLHHPLDTIGAWKASVTDPCSQLHKNPDGFSAEMKKWLGPFCGADQ